MSAPKILYALGLTLAFISCSDDEVNNKFYNLRAYLIIENVLGTPLHIACENWGEFCSITNDGSHLILTDASNKNLPIDIPAEFDYHHYNMGLSSGYIVGLPAIPEIGKDVAEVVCYDRACSNCNQNDYIVYPLKFILQSHGYAKCDRCNRTYNLNDYGIISDGPGGRPLYRYRVYYYSSPYFRLRIEN